MSVIKYLDFPAAFVATLLTLVLILAAAPYLAGADFGILKIPQLTPQGVKRLRIIGPVLVVLCILLFVPLPFLSVDVDADTVGSRIPITIADLTEQERNMLLRIRAGEHVDAPVQSFFKLAVLSGQTTESELDYFIDQSLATLDRRHVYFFTGVKDSIRIEGGGRVFIWHTGNRSVFKNAQIGFVRVARAIKRARSGKLVENDMSQIFVTIRGTKRIFDVEGIPSVPIETWIGFDLPDRGVAAPTA